MTEALGLPPATGVDEVIEKIKSLNRWDPAALKAYLDETEVALQKWQSETIDAVAEIVKQMKATGPGTSVAQAAQAVQAGKVETGEVVTPPAQELEDDKALAHPGLGQVVEFPDARDAGAHEQDPTALCSHGFRPLPRRGAKLAAGYGAFIESEPVIGHLAFREDWLLKHGINHEKADIVEVMGNSMEPTLSDGSLVLVDYQRTRRRSNRIFVVRSDDLVLIKRLVKDSHGEWLLVSDNDKEYKPVRWPQEAEVIGQVMWTGRSL